MKIKSNPRSFFSFIIISYAVFIFIVIQILSWSLSYNYEKSGTRLIDSLAVKNLDIAVNNVQNQFDSIKLFSQQLFVDKDILGLMYGNINDQQKLNAITYRLTSYSALSTYINSVYVYNKKSDYYYCTDQTYSDYSTSFFDKDIENIIKNGGAADFTPVLRSIPDHYNPKKSIYVYSLILYDEYSNKASSDAVLVVNIKVDPIIQLLESMKFQDKSSYQIVSAEGLIVCSSNSDDFFKNINSDKNMKIVSDNIFSSGSFNFNKANSSYYARYFYSPLLNWTFINITPHDVLYSSLGKLQHTAMIINLSVLIFAILVSYMLSRNYNTPVKLLLKKTNSYEKTRKDNYSSFRSDILENLLQKGANFENLSNCFKEFNIKLDIKKAFVLIHVQVDNSSGFYEAYDSKDRQLMLFSVGNIVGEILQESFSSEAIITDKNFLDILVNIEDNTVDKVNEILKKHLLRSQEEVSKFLKFSVSFTISNKVKELQKLWEEYIKVVEFSNYRLIFGHSAIIFSSEMNPFFDVFSYPLNNEKRIFDLLLLGKLQDVLSIYNEIVQTVTRHSYNDIIRFFTQFALSLSSFINKLNTTVNTGIDFEFYRFSLFLNKSETLEEINSRFEALFVEICEALEPGKEDKNNELLPIINDFIENNYPNPNLSMNMIADYLGKSPTYLGRVYKKLTGKSIPDFINELRLKKSMELLLKSNMKIEDICKNIGFLNEKYFYLFFKKHIGITPNEYRNRKPETNQS